MRFDVINNLVSREVLRRVIAQVRDIERLRDGMLACERSRNSQAEVLQSSTASRLGGQNRFRGQSEVTQRSL
jgi:hypothetical protein